MGGGWMRQQVEHLHPTTIDERPNCAAELSKEKEGEEEGSSCCITDQVYCLLAAFKSQFERKSSWSRLLILLLRLFLLHMQIRKELPLLENICGG